MPALMPYLGSTQVCHRVVYFMVKRTPSKTGDGKYSGAFGWLNRGSKALLTGQCPSSGSCQSSFRACLGVEGFVVVVPKKGGVGGQEIKGKGSRREGLIPVHAESLYLEHSANLADQGTLEIIRVIFYLLQEK